MFIYVKDEKVTYFCEDKELFLRVTKVEEDDSGIFEVDSVPDLVGRYKFIDGEFVVDEEETAKGIAAEEAAIATAYQGERRMKYPSIAEQLDKIFHEGIEGWKAEIQAIKDEFPKP